MNDMIERAAQVWCRPETSDIEMDVRLCAAFAEELAGQKASYQAEIERLLKSKENLQNDADFFSDQLDAIRAEKAELERVVLEHLSEIDRRIATNAPLKYTVPWETATKLREAVTKEVVAAP